MKSLWAQQCAHRLYVQKVFVWAKQHSLSYSKGMLRWLTERVEACDASPIPAVLCCLSSGLRVAAGYGW